jgi:hypothetical protein
MRRLIKRFIRKVLVVVHLGFVYNIASRIKANVLLRIDRWRMRRNYANIVKRIRRYPRDRKIRVLFWVHESAKWKAQSLYNAMMASSDFEPVIVLSVTKDDLAFFGRGIREKLQADERYYNSHGCRCVTNFDFTIKRPMSLKQYKPDVIFYQEPRPMFSEDSVRTTAKFALCCDVPYAIRTLGGTNLQQMPEYHQLMFLQFPPTDAQSRFYRSSLPEWKWAGTSYAIGHPILDQYLKLLPEAEFAGYVIYAPHFSFPLAGLKRQVVLSSFLENGRQILEYAKKHTEFKWLFKPHPLLYKELIRRGVWSKEDVDAYYAAWGEIGSVCTDGDYIRLFQNARALITDCGSFLVEFPMTGRPLIRLVPRELKYPLFPIFEKLYASFYVVRDLDEMYKTFAQVLERGEDPQKEERLKAVRDLGLMGDRTSAERIMDVLRKVCGRE